MKKLVATLCIVAVCFAACTNDKTTKETTETTGESNSSNTEKIDDRTQEIKDSTTMLDKKLADPNSTYSPDSLK